MLPAPGTRTAITSPLYGGIMNGLRPLLLCSTILDQLVSGHRERGLLNDVLVIAMGRVPGGLPGLGPQGSPDGRDHWPDVMSMTLAGGGFRHGKSLARATATAPK